MVSASPSQIERRTAQLMVSPSSIPHYVESEGSSSSEGPDRAQFGTHVAIPKSNAKCGQRTAILWILVSIGISALWGISISNNAKGFLDFKAVYYGTRCLLLGHNPYHQSEISAVYKAAGGEYPGEIAPAIQTVTQYVNLPTVFVLITPFALLPFGPAHLLWLAFAGGALAFASFLMWRLGARYSSALSILLIALMMSNNELAFQTGNTAVLVVGLCVVAAWCFAEDRLGVLGVVCFAVCLAVKPHDAGWIWLYFVLLGGISRRRALQALAITFAVGVTALFWVWHVAPQWMTYWHLNMTAISGRGGLNEPGPYTISGQSIGMVIDLQSAIKVLWNKPGIYNTISYLISGVMLLVWAQHTLKVRNLRASVWLGLAAVVAPTLLITYHRIYDTKLLLLAIPACVMLWAKRGVVGWIALLSTTAAIVFTGDIPIIFSLMLRDHLHISTNGFLEKALAVVVLEPTPLFLLGMGIFYLWAYVKSDALLQRLSESSDRVGRSPDSVSDDKTHVAEVRTPA